MKTLLIDIETYSEVSLASCGAYRYASDESFEVLLFSYSVDGGAVAVVDTAAGEKIPDEVITAVINNDVIKYAFNANFERVCLSRFFGLPVGSYLNPCSWRCTMVWCAYLGLPLSLKAVGEILHLSEKKMDEGKRLIEYFSVPCKPTRTNNGRTRNFYYNDPVKWSVFKTYNKRDVEVEMAIHNKIKGYPVPDSVWDEYHIDQVINDRGVKIDSDFAKKAVALSDKAAEDTIFRLKSITGLENPNSVSQMKGWLKSQGVITDNLQRKTVDELISETEGTVRIALKLYQIISKSSVSKYTAMLSCMCADGRVRGMFQFYGARTGRWAGRYVQLQNLPRNNIEELDAVRSDFNNLDYDELAAKYENIPDYLSQLIRTAFIPKPMCRFYVADFSAIEARVLAWYAGEEWRTEVFRSGGDIYCASASQMFKVPVEKHGPNGCLRQKGKIAELALGYGGSVGSLESMGALSMGLTREELPELVTKWRESNPNIVNFWRKIDSCIYEAISRKKVVMLGNLTFDCTHKNLFVTLPSGRKLVYIKPKYTTDTNGRTGLHFEGVNGTTRKWSLIYTYGAKLVENIVQATARDVLLNAMSGLSDKHIVMHIHDEVVIEAPGEISIDEICTAMSTAPKWADGLILNADGYVCDYYKKE